MPEEKNDMDPWESLCAEIERKKQEEQEAIQRLSKEAKEKSTLVLKDSDGRRGVVIAPSSRHEGNYQSTLFDKSGFITHQEAPDRDTLLRAAVEEYHMRQIEMDFLEQIAYKHTSFHRCNARFTFSRDGLDSPILREINIITPPRADEKVCDPLSCAYYQAYAKELIKQGIHLIPGKLTHLGSARRTSITEAVTKKLIKEHILTKKNLDAYGDVLCSCDPAIRTDQKNVVMPFIKRTYEKSQSLSR